METWTKPMFREATKTEYRRVWAAEYAAIKRATESDEEHIARAANMKAYDIRRKAVDPAYVIAKQGYTLAWRKREQAAHPAVQMLRRAKERARVKLLDFDLVEADIVVPTHCPCCGKEMRFDKRPNPDAPSLDRVDSARGYVRDNVAIICHHCNQVKNSGTAAHHEQIAAWMRRVGGN